MVSRALLLIVPIILLIAACSDDPVRPTDSDPLFAITVVDSTDQPLGSIAVGRVNRSPYLSDRPVPHEALPSTPIRFDLPQQTEITLTFFDYYGDMIAQPFDHEVVEGGTHMIDVDFPRPGFYRYELTTDADTTDTWLVVENAYGFAEAMIGVTNAEGRYVTEDTLLFPCLLGSPPPIAIRNEFGEVIDTTYDFYSDTVIIMLEDTLGGRMAFDLPLTEEPNAVTVTWAPY